MIAAAIFDIDGTIIDSVDLHAKCWVEAFGHFGKQVSFADVRSQIGKGGDQLLPVFLTEDEQQQIGDELENFRGDLWKREYMQHVKPFPCVRELFQKLEAAGIRIALASSAKGDELQFYKKLAQIDDLLEAETSKDDVEKSKPHPDIFHSAIEKLGSPRREDSVVVGDSPYDAMAATKAGIRSVGLRCGGFPEGDLVQAGYAQLFDDPCDLLERSGDWAT